MRPDRRMAAVLGGVALVTWGLLLYGDSLFLPYFFDDAVHFRWVGGYSLMDFWAGVTESGYYRPLPFTLWKLCQLVIGDLPPRLLHAFNLALHLVNGGLVSLLAHHLSHPPGRRFTSLVSGLFFLAFPFSYQVVPWVGALTHPLSTLLILGAVLTATVAPRTWPWLAGSAALSILALFTHETGLLVAVWILVWEIGQRAQSRSYRISWYGLLPLALGLAYLVFYFGLPQTSGSSPAFDVTRLVQNGAYLLQGLAFPVAPLARALMHNYGWSDMSAAYVSAALTLGALLLLAWRARRLAGALVACLFALVAMAPAWLMLPFDYVISGPRLLYLPSVGIAVAWAIGLQSVLALFPAGWRRVSVALVAVLALSVLLFSFGFVRTRQRLHHWGGQVIKDLTGLVSQVSPEDNLLCVNYPAWLAPRRLVYPVGHEGVLFLPNYMDVGDLVWVNGGPAVDVETLKFPNLLPEYPDYIHGVRGERVNWEQLAQGVLAADQVYAVHYTSDGITALSAGTVRTEGAGLGSPIATFGDRIRLRDAVVLAEGQAWPALRLTWESALPLNDADYRVFVHLYSEAGELVGQDDGYLLRGLLPLWGLEPGVVVWDHRHFLSSDSVPPGWYAVSLGLYDGESGQRFPAYNVDGTRFPDDAVPALRFLWPVD